jgi:NAD(P)-dependent dehydrogenase (short-subunit alcohol dehydrogenase family)
MEFQGYDKNFGLTGKVAFITGGAAGIGRAIATLFKEKNARLALADLNPAVREVASDLSADQAILEPALEVSENSWDRTLDLNLKAAFFLAQRIGKEMVNQRRGKIINIGSQAGMIALDRHVAYMASKAAIIGITKVLALEWARSGVQVNAISPTVVLTELGKKAWAGEVGEEFKRKLPAGRFAYPEEIAAAALFLAADASDMMNGANLVIDGGYTIQ